ncbi:common central domain of tyrosinase-domain-containing protein [Bombardia bombarda]|uniref:tyrosinase n=1 Tax=Bombardia bombarda TaxID=252184 RepID=A0AA39X8F2_9PEZI|nr:common central domain of tyrosinase-domain-containing protein [Bombardia bombarda]
MTSYSIRTVEEKTYAITGIKAGIKGDTVPLRLEVDSWYPGQNELHLRQNSLYLWALKFFEEKSPDDKLSFFQVAGIHGLPFMPWDEDTDAKTPNEGYCTHDSILFAVWHRPYLLLYEQLLYEVMIKDVIPKLPVPQRSDWLDAASQFRLPYWDWAQKKIRSNNTPTYDIPIIAKSPRVEVVDLNDGTSTVYIDNPMYKFTMPDNERMGCEGISDIQDSTTSGKITTIPSRGTSRWAPYDPQSTKVSVQWENGVVDNDKITQSLQEHNWYGKNVDQVPLSEMVYRLYLPDYIDSFTQFSTTKFKKTPSPASYLNLEYVHNNIHNWCGGFDDYAGHMSEPPVSAFDPIFWIHHCNVDRQFALWQAINVNNKKNWFEDPDEQLKDDGNWSIPADAVDTPTTALAPFHKDTQGTYFTSDDVRDWIKWGYSYPELQPWLEKYKKNGVFNQDLYVNDVKYEIKQLYSPSERAQYTADYIINVKYKRFALNGTPYTLYFFIGHKDSLADHSGLLTAHPDHVGYVYTFSNPIYRNRAAPGCQNCRKKAVEASFSKAQVPITGALLARIRATKEHGESSSGGSISSGAVVGGVHIPPLLNLGVENVEEYLEKNLHWRIKTVCGFLFSLLVLRGDVEGTLTSGMANIEV